MVYGIPLACGFTYVGQTERCVNNHLLEHERAVGMRAQNSEIARHVEECNGSNPEWARTEIIYSEKDATKRILRETIRIGSIGNCISNPSVSLDNLTWSFIRNGVSVSMTREFQPKS